MEINFDEQLNLLVSGMDKMKAGLNELRGGLKKQILLSPENKSPAKDVSVPGEVAKKIAEELGEIAVDTIRKEMAASEGEGVKTSLSATIPCGSYVTVTLSATSKAKEWFWWEIATAERDAWIQPLKDRGKEAADKLLEEEINKMTAINCADPCRLVVRRSATVYQYTDPVELPTNVGTYLIISCVATAQVSYGCESPQ